MVAYAAGGALDTVLPGRTGVFFTERTPASLVDAVRRLEGHRFEPRDIRAHAQTFDVTVFRALFERYIQEQMTLPKPEREFAGVGR